jgi:hypothetical protein
MFASQGPLFVVAVMSSFVLSLFSASGLHLLVDQVNQQYNFMTWNVRGLNSSAHQEDVKQIMTIYKPDLICIQETKMEQVTPTIIRNSLGPDYQDSFTFLPAVGSSGGS